MSRSRAVLKVAAVGFSVALAAGLISYRAGAFDWLDRPEPPPVGSEPEPAANPVLLDSSKSGRAILPPTGEQTTQPKSPAMLSSSKFAIVVPPPAPEATPPAKTNPPILGGSKSIAPLIPPTPPASQTPNPPK